jgi:LmbE family N-acetylglucosaminyl deacetylase
MAPHPDDETLGAGALISQTAREDRLIAIVYLTDGAGSHPEGMRGLASTRHAEALRAIRRLSGQTICVDWIGWQDAHPFNPGSSRFRRDAQHLAAILRRRRIDAVAVTGLSESHCDHVAAFRLASAAVRLARRPVALFAYPVWGMPSIDRGRKIRTRSLSPGKRRWALQAHRSQMSPAFGPGFRLPEERRRMTSCDILTLQRSQP